METWKDLSRANLEAAEALLRAGYFRSCVSRAYYAAYCAATYEIVQRVSSFPYGWRNPPHARLPTYIENNLGFSLAKKGKLITLVDDLRLCREDADYRPQVEVDEQVARDCVRNAVLFQEELWGSP